jgi:hypothetical protein
MKDRHNFMNADCGEISRASSASGFGQEAEKLDMAGYLQDIRLGF